MRGSGVSSNLPPRYRMLMYFASNTDATMTPSEIEEKFGWYIRSMRNTLPEYVRGGLLEVERARFTDNDENVYRAGPKLLEIAQPMTISDALKAGFKASGALKERT